MSKKLSFKKAAQKILEQSTEPMSSAAITEKAIENGLIETSGNTPEATMGAQIYVDISKNPKSPFIKVGKGLFAIKKQSANSLSPLVIIENQNDLTRKKLKERLHEMDPFQFEFLVADLLQKVGYENVSVTKRSGDKGIDVVANLTVGGITNVKTVIQAKRYSMKNNISGAVITQLRGSAEVDQRGLVITTSDFTKDAIEESKAPNKMPVSLINGEKLIELLIKHGVGIKREELYVLKMDEEYFQNNSSDTSIQSDSDKSRSLWPLPGGTLNYVETLDKFLEEIQSGNNTKKSLTKWYISNFENVESKATTQGYIYVPKNMGLTTLINGIYQLTESGESYLKSKSKDVLYDIMANNILVFDDVYEYIKSSPTEVNEELILEYLKDNFDIKWSTFAQVTFRLLWLINLDKIEKGDNGYKAKN